MCAVASGSMFVRWLRVSVRRKQQMWRMYGWFTGLMFCGSLFGTAAWALYLQFLVAFYRTTPGITDVEDASLNATQSRWLSAFLVVYALEFMCLSVAKLLVLFRTMDLSMPEGQPVPSHWAAAAWMVTKAVVAGNVVGLGGYVAAAVYFKQAADFYSSSAAAYAANATRDGRDFYNNADDRVRAANIAESAQNFCEVAVLLLIISAFFVAASAFSRFALTKLRDLTLAASGDVDAIDRVDELAGVRSHEERAETMVAAAATAVSGNRTLLQVVSTAAFVFATFLLRATYSTIHAISNAAQNQNADCASDVDRGLCDSTCYNTYFLIQTWLLYRPEFQTMVMLISSPLALLVALWGMTTDNMSKIMRSSHQMKTMRREPTDTTLQQQSIL